MMGKQPGTQPALTQIGTAKVRQSYDIGHACVLT